MLQMGIAFFGNYQASYQNCRKAIIINSSLHVTVANLMFYITLFKVTLLDVFNYLKSNLNLKLLPLNSGN